jgi:hypothetical protein
MEYCSIEKMESTFPTNGGCTEQSKAAGGRCAINIVVTIAPHARCPHTAFVLCIHHYTSHLLSFQMVIALNGPNLNNLKEAILYIL